MRILAITFLLLSCNVFSGERVPSLLSTGTWEIFKAHTGHLNALSLEKYTVTFNKNGTWTYSAKMTSRFEGEERRKANTWKVDGNTLVYTIGDYQGKSVIQIADTVLTLSPDPVLLYTSGVSIDVSYKSLQ